MIRMNKILTEIEDEVRNMDAAARKHLETLPVQQLVARLLESEAKLARQEKLYNEQDRDYAAMERERDAAREVLWCELYDAGTKPDIVSLANAARLRLAKLRSGMEIPF